jgi:hypothetical protein
VYDLRFYILFTLAFHVSWKQLPVIVEAASSRYGKCFHTPWKALPRCVEKEAMISIQILKTPGFFLFIRSMLQNFVNVFKNNIIVGEWIANSFNIKVIC